MDTVDTIIPNEHFDGKFLDVIYSREMMFELTTTEKKLIITLNGLAKGSGVCFAMRDTIARRLGKSDRTVSRTINTLVKKGFIHMEAPTLQQRRLYGATNVYTFLNHVSYGKPVSHETTTEVTTETSTEMADSTFIYSESLISNKTQQPSQEAQATGTKRAASRVLGGNLNERKSIDLTLSDVGSNNSGLRKSIIEERHAITQEDHKVAFEEHCNVISSKLRYVGHRFNPKAFVYANVKEFGTELVAKALKAITERIACISDARILKETELWGFGVDSLRNLKAMSGSSNGDWLGADFVAPKTMPGILGNMVKSF